MAPSAVVGTVDEADDGDADGGDAEGDSVERTGVPGGDCDGAAPLFGDDDPADTDGADAEGAVDLPGSADGWVVQAHSPSTTTATMTDRLADAECP